MKGLKKHVLRKTAKTQEKKLGGRPDEGSVIRFIKGGNRKEKGKNVLQASTTIN